jgi:hypothetical protein
LRFAGYNLGATQYIAAQDLILTLAAQGQLPSELAELRLFLAPILCHSPKEQAEFLSFPRGAKECLPGRSASCKEKMQKKSYFLKK